MLVFRFALARYAAVGLLATIAFLLGRRLTMRVPYRSAAERVSVRIALGLGVLAYLVLFLGLLGALYPWVVWPALGTVSVIACAQPTWFGQPVLTSRRLLLAGVSVAAFVLVTGPLWVLPLYPPAALHDATSFHLAAAKIFVQQHRVGMTPYLRFPVFPQVNEMLFTLGLLLGDDVLAQLVQFLMMLVTGLVLYTWGREIASTRAGVWAAALWLGSPLVVRLGATAYIDIGLALFVTVAIFTFSQWVATGDGRRLLLSAVFAGLAAGSKHSGSVLLCMFCFAGLVVGVRRRRVGTAVLGALLGIAVASPWYVRSWYYAGDPLFPVFGSVFGYTLWSPEDLASQFSEMRSRGTGVSWRSLLSLWSNLTWNQSVFNCEAAFSPVVGALLPAVLGVGALSAPLRVPLVFLLGGLAWWFCSVQILRYLIPWLGTWSLLTAVVLDRLAAALVPVRRPSSAMMVTVLGCTALLAPGWWYAYGEVAWQWPPPVKRRQRDAYLEERRPTYAAYKTLNDAHGRDYRLYAIYDGSMAYFADGTFMGEWWGVARYERITSRIHDGPALYRELRLLGADHLLVPTGTWFGSPPQDTFFRSRARLILETPAYWLFELARDDSPDP